MSGDRRTKYTKSIIQTALFELLKEKPLSKVTVTDICKRADINRSTFYSYYENVAALMTALQNDLFEDVVFSLTTDDWFDELLHLVDNNKDLFTTLLGPHGDSQFMRQLMYLGYDNSVHFWSKHYPNATTVEMDYVYAYVAYGVIGILENWICGGYRESIDEVGAMVYGFTLHGLTHLDHYARSSRIVAPPTTESP